MKAQICHSMSARKREVVSRLVLAMLFSIGVGSSGFSSAAPFDIAQLPLYLGGSIEPNLMYIHDDSGSMYWSYMPDTISGNRSTKRAKSAAFNKVYYDPAATYLPPLNQDGVSLGDASFTAAWFDGYDLSGRASKTTNLSTSFRPTWYYAGETNEFAGAAEPAYYYNYAPPQPGCAAPGSLTDDDCYVKVVVGTAERQNFANWYSYYRSRNYAAKAGISRAFATLGTGIRVGYGRINDGTATTIDGKSVKMVERGVRQFEDAGGNTYRKDFFDWLYGVEPSGNTPLRRALDAAGRYYENADAVGPWSTTPGATGGNILSCRQSYTILMTDGYWNSSEADTVDARANNDGTSGPTVSGPSGSFTYDAVSPFTDAHTNTLADIAMHYWKRDLHTGVANRVPTSPINPAFWQHMVTFGIGLGVTGSEVPDDVFKAIGATPPVNVTWGNPVDAADSSPYKIDDLLHAAVNSRGGFFSARDPKEFADALAATLAAIGDRTSSSAAVAANSTKLDSELLTYQARYESGGWTGEFLAYEIDPTTGQPKPTPEWEAGALISTHDARTIATWRTDTTPARGAEFVWADLSDDQRTAIGSTDVLNWLRGDKSKEESVGGTYRDRAKKLGDIVNSDPVFAGSVDFGYGAATALTAVQRASYASRRASSAFKTRASMVYVGANDGMLHAFDAITGVERFAYVPNDVFGNLASLSDPNYLHKYFVDGSPRVADAIIGAAWRTVLVGSTGAGGRAYFALDVDSPLVFDETKVLWEFTHAELGLAMGQASIVLTESGKWVAIFGNGYNSNSHKAQLFIVDLETGTLIKNFDTLVGSLATPNGLGTPIAVDSNFNGAVDLVYAGDMQGNLWKFDLSDKFESGWKFAYKAGSAPRPLFKALDKLGKAQPITAKPQVGWDDTGALMVYVGTGRFFLTGDQGNTDPQTFYGVKDVCVRDTASDCGTIGTVAKVQRSQLLEQVIKVEKTETFINPDDGTSHTYDIRLVTDNPLTDTHKGFLIDLISPVHGEQGERVTSPALVWDDRVIFVTQIPDADPCSFGGTSWIMELDPYSGARTTFSVFDLNSDGKFDDKEYVLDPETGEKIPVSGRKYPGGMVKTPAVFCNDDKCQKATSDTGGNLSIVDNAPPSTISGRQSWRQIR